MKCQKCNAQLNSKDAFCSICGTKVIKAEQIKKVSLKCANCNGTLLVDEDKTVLACPYCGTSELILDNDEVAIEKIRASTHKEIEMEKIRSFDRHKIWEEEQTLKRNEENKVTQFKNSGWFMFLIIAFIVAMSAAIYFFIDDEIASGLIAILQSGCFAMAWIMGMHIIKAKKNQLHILIAIIGIILVIPLAFCEEIETHIEDIGSDIKSEVQVNFSKIDWFEQEASNILPKPKSLTGVVEGTNSECTQIIIAKTTQDDYDEYCKQCKEQGFMIDIDQGNSSYVAYNSDGYKLCLTYYSDDKEMKIAIYNPIEFAPISLPSVGVGTLIPVPKSLSGKVTSNYDWSYTVYIEKMTHSDFEQYVQQCMDAGFCQEFSNYDNYFTADYSDDESITVSYEGNNIIRISVSGSINKDYSEYKR